MIEKTQNKTFFSEIEYSCIRSLFSRLYGVPATMAFVERVFTRKSSYVLLSARLSHRNSVRSSVRPSVCHTGGSVKSGAS